MQFLIETDVLREYLIAVPGEETTLRKALALGVCYTTMYNALELFSAAISKLETDTVSQMLLVVRVLGFSARYAQNFAEIAQEVALRTNLQLTERETMVLGMARTSKLTILTKDHFVRYSACGVAPVLISPEAVPVGQ